MGENQKQNLNGAALLVMATILSVTVAFLGWTAKTVYELHAEVATIRNQQLVNTEGIKEIQIRGSPVIQAVMVRLDTLQAGQVRIERVLEESQKRIEAHILNSKP